jgi:hypothetical protein
MSAAASQAASVTSPTPDSWRIHPTRPEAKSLAASRLCWVGEACPSARERRVAIVPNVQHVAHLVEKARQLRKARSFGHDQMVEGADLRLPQGPQHRDGPLAQPDRDVLVGAFVLGGAVRRRGRLPGLHSRLDDGLEQLVLVGVSGVEGGLGHAGGGDDRFHRGVGVALRQEQRLGGREDGLRDRRQLGGAGASAPGGERRLRRVQPRPLVNRAHAAPPSFHPPLASGSGQGSHPRSRLSAYELA